MNRRTVPVLLLAFALSLASPAPGAEFDRFEPDFRFRTWFHGPGFNDHLQAAVVYGGELVVAGPATQFNGDVHGHVMRWRDPDWEGMDYPYLVAPTAMAQVGDKLYAVGLRTVEGQTVHGVAVYHGNGSWGAIDLAPPQYIPSPAAVTGHEGQVFVGGWGVGVGGRSVVTLEDGAWSLPGASLPGRVSGFTAYGGDLVAVGDFDPEGGNGIQDVARWNGTGWSGFGTGWVAHLFAAVEFQGDLVVAGDMSAAAGVPVAHVARFDGSAWTALGSSLDDVVGSRILDLAVADGVLYALRGYNSVVRKDPNVFRWTGSAWESVGDPFGEYRRLFDLEVLGNRLLAVGFGGAAAFDGRAWSEVGTPRNGLAPDDDVRELLVDGDDLYVLGDFLHVGDLPASRIARWDGESWHALGGGQPYARSMTLHEGKLHTASYLSEGIGVWDGTTWETIDLGPDAYGFTIDAMASFQGDLVIAGEFSAIGGVEAASIARYDRTAWHPLGTGLTGCGAIWSTVHDLVVHDGSLIAGGTFVLAGGVEVGHVAGWDGTSWSDLGGGFDAPCVLEYGDVFHIPRVLSLLSWGDDLVAAGEFGPYWDLQIPGISIYGPPWSVPGGSEAPKSVSALTVHDGNLFACSELGITRWTGAAWEAIEMPGQPADIASDGTTLYIGGNFSEAGGLASRYLAAWTAIPVAVTLTGFSVERTPEGARLSWSLAEAQPGTGFDVFRGPVGERLRLTRSPLSGGTTFRFTDPSPPAGGADFWIRETERDGSLHWHGPVHLAAATPGPRPLTVGPNPFQDAVRLRFALTGPGRVTFEVFTVQGRRIRGETLDLGPGDRELVWDGRDDRGANVAPGVYFLRLATPAGIETRRVIRTR